MFEPHKYDHEQDRQVLLSDIKARMIDLTENQFSLPDAAWDAEPLRYFKLNEKWCAIVFGLLDWLEDPAGWKDATDDNFPGIQGILAFEVGIPIPTLPSEGDCIAYAPSASFIAYNPMNPFNNPDFIPPDYLIPPWMVNDDLEYPEIMGYQATDVFVPFGAITIDPIDLITFNLPKIIISVRGPGQVEIDLLAVSFGGIAILKVGSMPNIADIILDNIIDTGIQIFDLEMPPTTIIHAGNILRSTEVNIEAEADEMTQIYIVFAPKINDSIIPIAFGGGFRGVQLCGFEGSSATMIYEDTRFNPDTCSFEKRIDGSWSVIDGNDYWLECVRALMATKLEVKEAILESAQEIAARFLSGDANWQDGVCIDEEGNISVGEPGSPDDPDTGLDESNSTRAGGSIGIRLGFNELLGYINAWYNAGFTEAQVVDRFEGLYDWLGNTELVTFVDDYFANRVAAGTFPITYAVTLDPYLFCKGANLNIFTKWVIDTLPLTGSQEVSLSLAAALADSQLDLWFERGSQVPSTAYITYSCTPIAYEEITLDFSTANNPTKTTNGVWKQGHRYLIECSGTFADSDVANVVGDAMYSHNTATDVKTFTRTVFNANGVATPSVSECPFQPDHKYSFVLDKAAGSGNDACIITGDNGPMTIPNVTGIVTYKITDLGEFAL